MEITPLQNYLPQLGYDDERRKSIVPLLAYTALRYLLSLSAIISRRSRALFPRGKYNAWMAQMFFKAKLSRVANTDWAQLQVKTFTGKLCNYRKLLETKKASFFRKKENWNSVGRKSKNASSISMW